MILRLHNERRYYLAILRYTNRSYPGRRRPYLICLLRTLHGAEQRGNTRRIPATTVPSRSPGIPGRPRTEITRTSASNDRPLQGFSPSQDFIISHIMGLTFCIMCSCLSSSARLHYTTMWAYTANHHIVTKHSGSYKNSSTMKSTLMALFSTHNTSCMGPFYPSGTRSGHSPFLDNVMKFKFGKRMYISYLSHP